MLTNLRDRRADLAALGIGAISAAALPPLHVIPVLLLAIPGLLALISVAPSWRVAARRGWWFGFGHHLLGLYWITEAILIEDKASGQSLLQDLRQETVLALIPILPTADKLTRLTRVTPMMEAGQLALPLYAPWLPAFEAEFFTFPDSAHDDQVDAVSQYLNWLRSRSATSEMRVRWV